MALSVKEIQKAIGFVGDDVDGIIGKDTKAAINKFQKDHKLLADGIVGPDTEAVMREVLDLPVRPVAEKIPEPPVGKILWPTQAGCPAFYGQPGQVQLKSIQTAYPLYYDGKPMKTISVHTKIADPVKRVL